MAVLALPTFKRTTQHGYRAVLKVHVLPTWRDTPLREIDRLAIQQWVADRLRRGIGWQSVRPALSAGSEFAKRLRELSETHRTMVSLIAATGLRIGELLASRWSSLDLQVGTLTVRESVFEGQFQAPKTQRALRTIPLGPHAVKALSEHRARVMRHGEDDLVFGNSKGAPLRESKVLTTVLQPAAERAGLGRVTWHQFRHIHSSLLNDLNVPVKIAQEQLGHASISTTLNIYTHAVDASHRKAIEAVERELFVVLDHSGLQTAAGLEQAQPASNAVD